MKSSNELYHGLKSLIVNFEAHLNKEELRPKVLKLVEIVYQYRALGISISDSENKLSARTRILHYLQQYTGEVISGDELLVISGIQEYARRIRELRVDFGWPVISGLTAKKMQEEGDLNHYANKEILVDSYILLRNHQDKEAAHRYNLMKDIRKNKTLSGRNRILEFLRSNVGSKVTGEELSYVSNISDWPRRMRELRTEEGWPIMTKNTGRPDLPVGYYVLSEDKQDSAHDRHIRTEDRIAALDRDGGQCVVCGWPTNKSEGDNMRNSLELHHITHHVKGGSNLIDNLVTLCNVHHDQIHRKDKNNEWGKAEIQLWAKEYKLP